MDCDLVRLMSMSCNDEDNVTWQPASVNVRVSRFTTAGSSDATDRIAPIAPVRTDDVGRLVDRPEHLSRRAAPIGSPVKPSTS